MKPKCKNCGKVLQEEGHAYCKECREKTEKLILNRIDAAYREIRQLTNRLREVSFCGGKAEEDSRKPQFDQRTDETREVYAPIRITEDDLDDLPFD